MSAISHAIGRIRRRLTHHQRTTFLLASGLSTAGSFAGLTAKGWLLMEGSGNAFLLAANFALLTLPTLLVSGPAGVLADRIGSERVLIRAQWALLAAAVLGAIAIPISSGGQQDILLLLSTLGVGVASTYELTARNKYVALLVMPWLLRKPPITCTYGAAFTWLSVVLSHSRSTQTTLLCSIGSETCSAIPRPVFIGR